MALFGGIKRAKFRKIVVPGDELTLRCDIIYCKGTNGKGSAVAYINSEVTAEVELIFALKDRE